MRKPSVRVGLRLVLAGALGFGTLAGSGRLEAGPRSGSYWSYTHRGANLFDHVETQERIASAASQGIRMVRLAPDKWQGKGRDFLIGDASDYRGLVPEDLARLRAVLDACEESEIQVVLVMLSLPGARWRQNNDGQSDFRIYTDPRYLDAAVAFWRDLALALRDHQAIVGYDLLNEPHPERATAPLVNDLNAVYGALVPAIRKVDPTTPIIVESGNFAAPDAFTTLRPIEDDHVLYSFHFYEPWAYVDHRSEGRWTYPGMIPGDDPDLIEQWDARVLEGRVAPVLRWLVEHAVPAKRIFVGEFGCPRTNPGAAAWLGDVIEILDDHRWHWAFYAYREDRWPVMDYELGASPVPAGYWQALEQGRTPDLVRKPGPLWNVIIRDIHAAAAEKPERRVARR